MGCTARLLGPWDSPGKNVGVDCCFLLQGIFPTQGLPADSYQLSYEGSPFVIIGIHKGLPWAMVPLTHRQIA